MKKWTGLLLVAAVAFAACGGDEDDAGDVAPSDDADQGDTGEEPAEDAGGDAGAGESVTLNVLVEGGGLQLQQEAAELFEAETGHTVEFTEVPYAGVFDRLSAEAASGSASFDVATIDVIWIPTFADFAEPLDDLFTADVISDLPESLVADAQFDGNYVGMPTWANAEILFYRKDMFEDPAEQEAFEAEYGYPLAPPTTWEEFRDMAIFFTRDTDGDGTVDFWGTDVKGGVETEWLAHVLQAGSPGTVLDADGNIIIDNPEHVAALEYYVDLHCVDGVSPTNVLEIDWGAAQNLFYQGQTAMMRFWAHAYRLTPEDSTVDGLVGVAPMIGGPGGVAAIPGPWYNIVPASGDNVEVAKQFVKFLYDHNELGINAPLGLAARDSAYAQFADQEGFEHFGPLVETLGAPATVGRPLVSNWQEITDEVLVPLVQEALGCDREPAEILADARSQIEVLT